MAPLPGVGLWTRGSGLEIVLLLAGAILLTRFATWLGGRITDRIGASAGEADAHFRLLAAAGHGIRPAARGNGQFDPAEGWSPGA